MIYFTGTMEIITNATHRFQEGGRQPRVLNAEAYSRLNSWTSCPHGRERHVLNAEALPGWLILGRFTVLLPQARWIYPRAN
jgi:hypothetical protein